jgi:hypothetical protein
MPVTMISPGVPRQLKHSFVLQELSLVGVTKVRIMYNPINQPHWEGN